MSHSTTISRDQFVARLEEATGKVIVPNEGLFGPESATWHLLRNSVGFLGAGRAVLLQTAHPWVANGVDQHSKTKTDPLGRFHRTFIGVFSILFGSVDQVLAVSQGLHRTHSKIVGKVPDQTGRYGAESKYFANQVEAMLWVHATLWDTYVVSHELVYGPIDLDLKERFYQEIKRFALCFGVPMDMQPRTWRDFEAYNRAMWESDALGVGEAGRTVKSYLFRSKIIPGVNMPLKVLETVTAEILPPRIRDGFELPASTPKTRAITASVVTSARAFYKIAPPRLRYLPVYFEAMDRVAGKPHSDATTRSMIKLMLGREELVARDAVPG